MKSIVPGIIILAAGSSSRLGQPKQLVDLQGLPMLQRIINETVHLPVSSRLLVLGAFAGEINGKIDAGGFEILINQDWQEGMASSIRNGVRRSLEMNNELTDLLILLADQPLVTETFLSGLIQEHQNTGKGITASRYGKTFGVPAIFNRQYFPALMELSGDRGAKQIIRDHINDTGFIDFENGNVDIDTKEDYEQLLQLISNQNLG